MRKPSYVHKRVDALCCGLLCCAALRCPPECNAYRITTSFPRFAFQPHDAHDHPPGVIVASQGAWLRSRNLSLKGFVPPAPYANFMRARLPHLVTGEVEEEFARRGARDLRYHLLPDLIRCGRVGNHCYSGVTLSWCMLVALLWPK